jgi:uncharacterized protein YaaR (DUF327 family)
MARKTKRPRRRVWWWVLILVIALGAILAGYFLAMQRDRKDGEPVATLDQKQIPLEGKDLTPGPTERDISATGTPVVSQEIMPADPESREAYCKRAEKDVRDFFQYLSTKDYIRHIQETSDPFEHFLKIVARLNSKLPIPAGESADSAVLNSNIYHLFRVLDRKDIRLIREVMANEADTLEINIEMLFRWLTLGNHCPDPQGLRPTQEALYHYAGFFLNTIGGRSYLFRRPFRLRLLGTYYSLLIIHEADKKGRNPYGIDPFPHIPTLAKEISLYSDFRFQEAYQVKLKEIEAYYLQRR